MTKSKAFSGAATQYGAAPNTQATDWHRRIPKGFE